MACDAVSMEPYSTVLLASDGILLYWVYVMKTVEQIPCLLTPSEKTRQHAVYLQVLTLKVSFAVTARLPVNLVMCFAVLGGGVVSSEARQAGAVDAGVARG